MIDKNRYQFRQCLDASARPRSSRRLRSAQKRRRHRCRPKEAKKSTKSSSRASALRCRTRSAAKRDNIAFTDSIFAEDIGKFPDLNLAESLQRIPGVQIARDFTGEGTSVAVRGLGKRLHADHAEWRAGRNRLGQQHRQREPGPRHRPRVVPDGTVPPADGEQDTDRQAGRRRGCREHRPAHRASVRQKGLPHQLQRQGQLPGIGRRVEPAPRVLREQHLGHGLGEFGILGGVAYSNRKYRSDGFNTIGFTTVGARHPLPVRAPIRSCNSFGRSQQRTPATAIQPGLADHRSRRATASARMARTPGDPLTVCGAGEHAGRHLRPVLPRSELLRSGRASRARTSLVGERETTSGILAMQWAPSDNAVVLLRRPVFEGRPSCTSATT